MMWKIKARKPGEYQDPVISRASVHSSSSGPGAFLELRASIKETRTISKVNQKQKFPIKWTSASPEKSRSVCACVRVCVCLLGAEYS